MTDSPRRPFQRWAHYRTEIGPVRVHGRAFHQPCAELALNPRCGLTLPTTLCSWLWVGGRHSQNRPTSVVRNLNPSSHFRCLRCCTQGRTRVDPVQMVHHVQSHFRVSFPNHGGTVGPACPQGRLTGAEASRRPRHPWTKVMTQWSSQLDLLPLKLGESVLNTSRKQRCGLP